MTWWEIFIIVVAAAYVLFVIGLSVYRKKHGKSSCDCGCESCPHCAACKDAQKHEK